ncbi:sperm-associated antigen 1 [Suncus etruscus]|uniref:sperm-associated antigen 1 n=1 Tax=Suncus etruscus TaxID=109475 RepID=UPI0021108ED0|nr:sperm-associated antigen 1 [Suncus etruscus]
MTTEAEACPSLWGFGTTKTFKIPVEHLDFKYIEKCSDVKHLEKIFCVLRSGDEGYYPELTEFCEKRLTKLAPQSRALRKEKPAATASSFAAEEWEKIHGDLKSWVSEIKEEEDRIQCKDSERLPAARRDPPVRGSNHQLHDEKGKGKYSSNSKPAKKKIPRDYAEWDKFDVEKECSKLDEDYKEKTVVNNKLHLSKIKTSIDITGLTEKERVFLATHEREKGNEAFNSGDYEEAIMYYTRSLSALPSVAAYNNRAQAAIRLENWNSAFLDCEKVLELEPGNIKALLRRATTYKHQNKLLEAKEDLCQVLAAEPHDELAKPYSAAPRMPLRNLRQVGESPSWLLRQAGGSGPGARGWAGGAPLPIGGSRSGRTGPGPRAPAPAAPSGSRPPPAHRVPPARPSAAGYHGQPAEERPAGPGPGAGVRAIGPGARGQENAGPPAPARAPRAPRRPRRPRDPQSPAEDTRRPSARGRRAVSQLRPGSPEASPPGTRRRLRSWSPAGTRSAEELSILYANRAACHLKDGDCRGCVQDCSRALELRPFSVKPLLRRAVACETLERYREAYVDYQTALRVDFGIQAAKDGTNRLTRVLLDLDGPGWREKLPPIPVVPASVQLQVWQPCPEQPPNQDQMSPAKAPGDYIPMSDENLFKTLKEEGNQHVKDKNYTEAVSKYSACLKINDKECAIYTNRALCYLRLGLFEAAKQDCEQALGMEAGNVKALYRRALAQKGLQNYQQSLNDLQKVLQLDASIAEAQRELEEVTGLLKSKETSAPNSKDRVRRKIDIQEVSEEPESTPEGVSPHHLASDNGDKSHGPPGSSEPLPFVVPGNAYEFGQVLSAACSRQDAVTCASLLASTPPEHLPALLSNKLEADMLLLLIQALKNGLLGKDPALVYQHLFYLSKAERFRMVLTLIGKDQKEQIKQLFDALTATPNEHFTAEEAQALSSEYYSSVSSQTSTSQKTDGKEA